MIKLVEHGARYRRARQLVVLFPGANKALERGSGTSQLAVTLPGLSQTSKSVLIRRSASCARCDSQHHSAGRARCCTRRGVGARALAHPHGPRTHDHGAMVAILLPTRASAGNGQERAASPGEESGERKRGSTPGTSIFDTLRRADSKANANILARTLAREARQTQEAKWAVQNQHAAEAAIDAAENEIRAARFAQRLRPVGPFGKVSRTGFPRLGTPHTTFGFCVRGRRGDTPPPQASGWDAVLGSSPRATAADPWKQALPGAPKTIGPGSAIGALGAAAASSSVARAAAVASRSPRTDKPRAGQKAQAEPRSEQLPLLLPSLMPPKLVNVNPRGVGAVELAAELPVPPPPIRRHADRGGSHSRPPELLPSPRLAQGPSPRSRHAAPSAEAAGHIFSSAPKPRLNIPGAGGERDTYWEMHKELRGAAYIDPLARGGLFGAPPPLKGKGPGSWLGVG